MSSHKGMVMDKRRRSSSLAEWLRGSPTTRVESGQDKETLFAQRWGVASCAQCGRTIMLGEKSVHLRTERGPVTICSRCAADTARVSRRAA
jgi:hypothetical protein